MITSPKPELFQHGMPPMRHQKEVFEQSRSLEYYGLFHEMGTGKSLILIDTAVWLYLNKEIDGLIIISDKGAYLNWPVTEIPKCMHGISYRIHSYSSTMNKAEVRGLEDMCTAKDDVLDILVMNVESFSGDKANDWANKFITGHYTMIAVDEATSIKSMKSERTKKLLKLGLRCDYRRVLTGTPITHSPLDLFAICSFLKPGILGHRTFVGFRNEYAVMQTMRFGTRSFETIAGYRHLDKLATKLLPFTSRVLKSECLDLPDKVYEVHYVEQTPEQQRMYDDLKTYAMSQFDQGLLTVTSAITLVNKLHQINCGHVRIDDKTTVDIPSNRLSALLELVDKIEGKVLIWCAFQRDVEIICEALKARNGCYPVHYYGKTTDSQREDALRLFAADAPCRWFVGTAATGGKGLTLTQASTTIYYSNTDVGEDRWQSEDRNHRKGQTNKVTYHDLVARGTVDEKILARLKSKKDLAHFVLDSFRELVVG